MRIHDLHTAGAIVIQNGFPCGNWNDVGDGIPQLRPFNVTDGGRIDWSAIKYIETDQKLNSYLLRRDDVIFNNTNSEDLVGKTALWDRSDRAVLSNHMTIVRVIDQSAADAAFIAFFLLFKWYAGHFKMVCRRHVNQASVSRERLCDTEFPPFGVAEQRQIAAVLSAVQRAVERQERLIALTAELKKALMHKLFTEGTRGERRKPTEIGAVPESWVVVPLGELCKRPRGKIQTGPFGSILHKSEYQDSGTPILNPIHLVDNRVDHSDVPRIGNEAATRLHRYLLERGDLLFARRGDIGRHAIVTDAETGWFCGTGCFIVRVSDPCVDPEFLNAFVSKAEVVEWLRSHAAGVIMPNLSNRVLDRMPVCFPSRERQAAIVAVIRQLDEKSVNHAQSATALNSLFRTLLHQLMTARVRVGELDLAALGDPSGAPLNGGRGVIDWG